MILRSFLIFLTALLFGTHPTQASTYFAHTRNESLADQLEKQPWRIAPRANHYSLALDTYLYKPWGTTENYYHGNGYWVSGFAEFRPHEDLALNVKLAAYNGASSYGFGAADYIQPFVGFSWTPRFVGPDWKINFRYFDLDRQTLGAGLLLENKEMNGLYFTVAYGDFRFKSVIDGTGGFYREGDLYYQHIDWKDDLIGLSYAFINYENKVSFIGDTETGRAVNEYGIPAVTLFSKAKLTEAWSVREELGYRNSRFAALAALLWKSDESSGFRWSWENQARWSQAGFAEEWTGYIQHDYVSPETYDKSFTESRNIWAVSDDVIAIATRFDMSYRPKPWLELGTSNELYRYFYGGGTPEGGWFYKQNLAICPYADRPSDCLSFFVSNKAINARGNLRSELLPARSFARTGFFGIEAFVYF